MARKPITATASADPFFGQRAGFGAGESQWLDTQGAPGGIDISTSVGRCVSLVTVLWASAGENVRGTDDPSSGANFKQSSFRFSNHQGD
jgi:hypothetical protein